jgi:hypothetical protein
MRVDPAPVPGFSLAYPSYCSRRILMDDNELHAIMDEFIDLEIKFEQLGYTEALKIVQDRHEELSTMLSDY